MAKTIKDVKTVKMDELNLMEAVNLLAILNKDEVTLEFYPKQTGNFAVDAILFTTDPIDLRYPEGWYYDQGYFSRGNVGEDVVMMDLETKEPWELLV